MEAVPSPGAETAYRYQKETKLDKLLPYYEGINAESQTVFAEIKTNLGKAAIMREVNPGCRYWIERLRMYFNLYDLRISKEDHVTLIKLLYDLLVLPGMDFSFRLELIACIQRLLRKPELISPEDLEVPWKPLYDLWTELKPERATFGRSAAEQLYNFITDMSKYFPVSATEEILSTIMPIYCPMDKIQSFVSLRALTMLLPTMPYHADAGKGYNLWLKDLFGIWEVCNNSSGTDLLMMKLMNRLAWSNAGRIDWEPYMDIMFTRIMRGLKLPVLYGHCPRSEPEINTEDSASWIIAVLGGGSSAQKHLTQLLNALESYFYPANSGRWVCKLQGLVFSLPQLLLKRLSWERKKDLRWIPPVPENKKITEEDISEFANSLHPIMMLTVNSNNSRFPFLRALYALAWLRPSSIIPSVLERLYQSVNSQTEPHRVSSGLMCVGVVVRPMVEGKRLGYADGPLQVVPLLMTVLSCIDPNDMMKTTCAYVVLSRILVCVPLVDCSQEIGFHPDMTPEEEELCRSTAELEDFLMQMIDRLFSLVHHTSSENVRHEQKANTNSKLDILIQAATNTMASRMLYQASSKFFKAALYKLHTFITSSILESAVPLLGAIVSAFMEVRGEETLKMLFPPLAEAVLSNTESEDVQKEQILSSDLMYNLGLLSHLTLYGQLSHFLPYKDTLYKVLERTLHLENLDGHLYAQKILQNLVGMTVNITPLNIRSSSVSYDLKPGESLLVRDWGRSHRINNLSADWHVPDEREFSFVQELVNKFLPPELYCIERFIQGQTASREELQRSLRIIKALLECQPLLPFWDEAPLVYDGSVVPDTRSLKVFTGLRGKITMPDGSNIRLSLIHVMKQLQDKLLTSAEDDTLSCILLIKVWRRLLLHWVKDISWLLYKDITKWERDPLSFNGLTRTTLMMGARTQARQRIAFFSTPLTATHAEGLQCIFKLSTSHYSKVRKNAQVLLNQMAGKYYGPLMAQLLLPLVLHNLKEDTVEQHELFKGTLYVLASSNATYDWKTSGELWTALVLSKPTEKLSIIKKLEEMTINFMKQKPVDSVRLEIPDSFVQKALVLWEGLPAPIEPAPDVECITKAYKLHKSHNTSMLHNWTQLQLELVNAAESTSHWRHAQLALVCLQRLLLDEERSPPQVVRFVLNAVVSDNIHIRKVAMRCACVILQQQKQETKHILVNASSLRPTDGPTWTTGDNREDALWLQYDKEKRPLTETMWEEQRFVHKEYMGYLMWPQELKIPCPSSEQAPLDEPFRNIQDDEKEVDNFFLNEKNISLLISFNALEKKTHEEFPYTVCFFARLMRNTGDKYLPLFKPHIENLLQEKQETHQMFLFELLAGIIRGTKRWPFNKVNSLWEWLGPVIRAVQENFCIVECDAPLHRLAFCHWRRDINTQHWLIEILMDDPLRDGASILGCRRLTLLKSLLMQKNWRATSISTRMFEYVQPFLMHPYKNVRNSVGSLLGKIFLADIQLPTAQPTKGPHLADFIASVLPDLEVLKSLNITVHTSSNNGNDVKVEEIAEQLDRVEVGNTKEDSALRLFKTVSACIQDLLYNSPMAVHPCFYELFELSTLLENVEKDKELKEICQRNLTALSAALTLPQYIPTALEAIRKVDVSPSWSMRAACLSFLQVLVFQNMAIFRSRDEWVQEVVGIVVQRLDDVWLEVQQKAGEVLGGMLHCHFIPNSEQLLEELKKKAQTKLSRKSSPDPAKLRKRHAGIIGLCAYVSAFPYNIPDFVPEIIGILGAHLNDPQPIPTTIRKMLSNFQRTHTADWQQHRLRFTEDQLNALNDMILPPPHYV